MTGIIFALAVMFGLATLIRWMARIPYYYLFIPGNGLAIITADDRGKNQEEVGGGEITDLLHGVPGKHLVKEDPNPMNWNMVEGADPEHSGLLYNLLRVQTMGLWRTTRTNVDRRLRFKTKKGTEKYAVEAQEKPTRFIYFSGELTVKIEASETSDGMALEFEIDLIVERTYPLRAELRLADSFAFLVSKTSELVNRETSIRPAEAYYGGTNAEPGKPSAIDTGKNKEELKRLLLEDPTFKSRILEELGLTITDGSIRDVDMVPKFKELMAKKVEEYKSGEARLVRADFEAREIETIAEGKKKAALKRNEAQADHITKVIIPASESSGRLTALAIEAYRKNRTMTHLMLPGSDVGKVLSIPTE